ncbi:MAG: hydrogen gas-evolving membrane-bound hydrogenase subunit E [Candidatus Aenigmarchaeota archaeon]
MIMRNAVFSLCVVILFVLITSVLSSPLFSNWESKDVARYYIEDGAKETGAANIVNSIVWDFRSFDTLGEETVLFTAAVGVLTVIIFGFKIRKMA